MLSIGKLAQGAGVKVPTIRYYEEIGLLSPADRSAGNQRLYARAALERLTFIRHARELGFPLDTIRDLLSLSDRSDQPCAEVDAIARAQLDATRARIRRLRALETELERMLDQCACGTVSDCRVIEALGEGIGETGEAPPQSGREQVPALSESEKKHRRE